MYCARLIRLVVLATPAGGCGAEPLVCPDEGVLVTTAVANRTAQAFPDLDVRDTVLRTGRVLDITAAHPSGELPAGGVSLVPIFSNAFKDEIRPTGEAVAVVVSAGDQSASGRYEFGSDGCRVHKLAGPDTLEVE